MNIINMNMNNNKLSNYDKKNSITHFQVLGFAAAISSTISAARITQSADCSL